jgi:hypothetical protein
MSSYNEATKRHAVLEDDGLTAWLYLHGPSDDPGRTAAVERACFVYSREAPIDARDVESYRPKPPPIAKDYATEAALTEEPAAHRWAIEWSTGGQAVLLRKDGQPWCLVEVNGASRHGHCKGIKVEGPWGSPWDQQRFDGLRWGGQPDGPANRGQPVGPETNRTSAAAGPGG